jgi:hypothetical protein
MPAKPNADENLEKHDILATDWAQGTFSGWAKKFLRYIIIDEKMSE